MRRRPDGRRDGLLGRAAASAVGGLLLAGAFPPWGAWPLALAGPALLLLSLAGAGARARTLLGFLFGITFFGSLLFWVAEVGLHGWVLLTLGEAGFAALVALAAGPVLECPRPLPRALGWAGLWILIMEVLRGRLPLGGFPWGPLAAPVVGTPLALLAPVGGALAVSGLVAFLGGLLALAVGGARRAALLGLVGVGVVVAAALPLQPVPPEGQRLRVAVVQGNVPLPAGPATPERSAEVLRRHVALSRTLPPGHFDLVVWPEDVLDLASPLPDAGGPAPEPLASAARDLRAWLVAGVVSDVGARHFANAAVSVRPTGRVAGVYRKTRPVPFGEYVPGRRFLGFVGALRAVPRDMVPGEALRVLPVPGGAVGTPISYEVAFARIVRGLAALGAGAIVVPTNTSSYGPGAAVADQELQLTRLRARETGLWAVQAAPSGISALVDPGGRVVSRTDVYRAAVLRGTLRLGRSSTPFTRLGEVPALAAAALAAWSGGWARAAGAALSGTRSRRRDSRAPGGPGPGP